IEKTEEYTQSMDKKHEINEDERKKILESEQKLNSIAETLRARQQAEEEWDQQGLFKKLRGNRSEFVTSRIKEILGEVSKG
ncbi:hypothetical protein OSK38_26790, partial [Escherichia coli]|nr:hypothetical protein [Escherichia coli]